MRRKRTRTESVVAAAILNPPAPTKALKKAAKRYRELFGHRMKDFLLRPTASGLGLYSW